METSEITSDEGAPHRRLPEYLVPYQTAVDRSGPVFSSLLWGDRQRQAVRFHVFTEELDLSGRVIVDLGCGRGDFLLWLHAQRIPYRHYIGCEALPSFFDHCCSQVLPRFSETADFLHLDFVADPTVFQRLVHHYGANILIFCGSLNTMPSATATTVLQSAWNALHLVPDGVLAFNFIRAKDGRESTPCENGVRRFPPDPFLCWAAVETPHVHCRTDYLQGYDLTLIMRRAS